MPPPTSKRHYRPFLQRLVLASRHGSKSLARARERRPSGNPASRFESNNPTNPRPLTLRSNRGWDPGGGETRVGNPNERGVRDEPARRGEARLANPAIRKARPWSGMLGVGSGKALFRFQNLVWPAGRRRSGDCRGGSEERRGIESNGFGSPSGSGSARRSMVCFREQVAKCSHWFTSH
jgi:hypothetical protein